jgi:transcriptional regulator with XRE-family HTH domain
MPISREGDDAHTKRGMRNIAVGLRIAALRKERKVSPIDFAKSIGLTLGQLVGLEKGSHKLGSKTASLIAAKYGVTIHHLLTGE